ncbi:putative sulfate exporter family transporter [Bradyrhizobium sp. Ash2021]|uniref:YeiH family protein n=1 Tax=Bradyrhizobium sp. Ash2021 TaxID=2954771 RepID=UPI002814A3FF|nr:putative sulfate exporter family transporter [Bradyrhizobium sp. Ash2021]WMT72089.1 putative sulfate exporter family transporter [Bradyrhizobium sp. Ash2021]
MTVQNSEALWPSKGMVVDYAPGVALSTIVAIIGYLAAPYVARVVPIPSMVIALVVGIALNPLAARPLVKPGMAFCVRTVLRWAVALLGLRVGLADIAALGPKVAALIIISMVVTVVSGFLIARWYGREPGFGALVGVGTAVCGASATLAASTVVPNYPSKQPDIAFVVVAVNAFATLAMLLYPPVCVLLGFDPQTTGVMLGGTIHDVAQVVGAGYAVSTAVGNTAVVVKLFRVFLLLPVVVGVSWYFTRIGQKHGQARVPVPVFAIVFLALSALNSAVPLMPSLLPTYAPMKSALVEASTWGLLVAIGALGLGTSIKTIIALGWRHITTVLGSTAVIFAIVTGGLVLIRHG